MSAKTADEPHLETLLLFANDRIGDLENRVRRLQDELTRMQGERDQLLSDVKRLRNRLADRPSTW